MNKPIDHIAIIMDGNRRWARAHSLPEVAGHEFVVNHVIEELVDECVAQHIPYLTLWAFSTENWNRSTLEVNAVLNLFRKAFEKNVQDLHKKGVRLLMIGDLSRFPEDIQKNVARWIEMSKNCAKYQPIHLGNSSTPREFPIPISSFAQGVKSACLGLCFGKVRTRSCIFLI